MLKLKWEYQHINNPQYCLCHSEEEAKAIKRFVKRIVSDLGPRNFVVETGDQIAITKE